MRYRFSEVLERTYHSEQSSWHYFPKPVGLNPEALISQQLSSPYSLKRLMSPWIGRLGGSLKAGGLRIPAAVENSVPKTSNSDPTHITQMLLHLRRLQGKHQVMNKFCFHRLGIE